MRRFLANLVALTSVLFLVGVATLWQRSYLKEEELRYDARTRVSIRSLEGVVALEIWSPPIPPEIRWSNHRPTLMNGIGQPVVYTNQWEYTGWKPQKFHILSYRTICGFGWDTTLQWMGNGDRFGEKDRAHFRGSVLSIRYWVFAVLTMLPLVWWFNGGRRLRRRQLKILAKGRCFICGYDLRATPQRCPECGTEFAGMAVV